MISGDYRWFQEIECHRPEPDIGPCVGLVRLLHLAELEVIAGVLGEVPGSGKLLGGGEVTENWLAT